MLLLYRTEGYLKGVQEVESRLDAGFGKRKRKKRLRCKPGFEQRGAVCQPIKAKKTAGSNKSNKKQKTPKLPKGTSAAIARAATLAVAGMAAVGVGAGVVYKREQFGKATTEAIDRGITAAEKRLGRKLKRNEKLEVDNTIGYLEKEFKKESGKEPKSRSFAQKLGKQVAIELAAQAGGISVGNLVRTTNGSPVVQVASTVADISTTKAVRKKVQEKYGSGFESEEGQNAVALAFYGARFGIGIAVAMDELGKAQTQQQQASRESTREANERKQREGNFSSETADDWHKTINVERSASEEDVKRAYRQAARKNHPDLTTDPAEKKRRQEEMKKINEAYDYYMKRIKKQRRDSYLFSFEV